MTLVGQEKPVINIFNGKKIDWVNSEPLRNLQIFDSLVICNAMLPLSGASIYLPLGNGPEEDLVWFNKLSTDLFQQVETHMKESVLKIGDQLLTKKN